MERTLEAEDKKKIVQCLQESRIQLVRFHNPYKEVGDFTYASESIGSLSSFFSA